MSRIYKYIIAIITILQFHNLNGQVRIVPDRFDPVYEFPDSGLFIVDGSFLGKVLIVTDANDGFNNEITLLTPAQDSVATYNYSVSKFTLGSVLTFKFVGVTDTVFIQSDGGVNGRIGTPGYSITSDVNLEFVYTSNGWVEKLPASEVQTVVSSYSEIQSRKFNVGDRIIVTENNDFSLHIVKSDSVSGFTNGDRGVIVTANSLYAHLQPTNGKIYATHMGAVGDGSTINDNAFERANLYCIKSGLSSHIYAPKGHYKFDSGFYLGDLGGGFTGISISGNAPTYTSDSDTRFSTDSTNNFIIGVIGSRNVFIENIDFRGPSNIWTSKEVADRTINWDSYYRTNSNSPFAAIVIDPFYNAVSTANRYPDWVSSYPVATSTSQVTIRNCSIRYFESAIAEDPTAQNFNGDNIKLENSRIERCRKVWYSRSSQARANSIENCYITFVETVIDNAANGDFPRLEEINGAGFIYQIFNVDGEFGRVIVNNSHFESFMSFGLIDVPEAEFSNCIFKFDLNYGRVPITLNGSTPVTFRGCEIRNFSNCNTITYFSHKTRLKFIDCTIEALEFMKGNDQDRSIRANNEVFVNTYFVCYGSYVSNSDFKKFEPSSEDISGELASQNSIYSINGNLFQVNDYPYAFRNIEVNTNVKKYTVNSNRYGYYFTTNNPSRHRVNDVIWSRESTNGVLICIGTVKSISNDTVFTDFPSYFLNPTFDTTNVNLLHRRHRKFFSPILVEVKIGSDTVKILDYAGQDSDIFTVGDKLGSFENYYNESLSGDRVTPNIHIKSIGNNGTHDYLIINQSPNATISSTDTVYLSDVPYLTEQWSVGTTNSYIPNGIVAASNSDYILMSNSSGIVGSSILSPNYDTIWYGRPTLNQITSDTVVISIAKTADDSDYNVGNDFVANANLQEINVWITCPSGAGSNSQLLLPATSSFYLGKKIRVIAVDASGTYDVQISASTNELWQAGSLGTSLTLTDGDTYTIICMEDADNPGTYLWAIQN